MSVSGRRYPAISYGRSYYGSLGSDASRQRSLDPEALSQDAVEAVVQRSRYTVVVADESSSSSCSACLSRGRGCGGWKAGLTLSAFVLGALVATVRFGVHSSLTTAIVVPAIGGHHSPATLDNNQASSAYHTFYAAQDRDSSDAGIAGNLTDHVVAPPIGPGGNAQAETSTASATASAAHPLSFTATNFYHLRDGKPAQDYPWLTNVKLVEPHRDTTLTVANPREGFDYRWEIRAGIEEEAYVSEVGEECTVVFTQLDDNVVALEEIDADGEVGRRLEEKVVVKYVRREIRTLTGEEREELLNAMVIMWEVRSNGGRGRELFGEEYTDVWGIGSLHFTAAGHAECDHFHDGLGFLTSHSQLSNTFEANLQLVNPKLTLPYWDFTIEATRSSSREHDGINDVESQRQSPLLQASWFGGSDPEDHQVKDGRWGYLEVPSVADVKDGQEGDIFERIRAPWNVDDRPYLTRGLGKMCGIRTEPAFPWPTCQAHYDLLARHSDFYGWVWDAQYDAHGPVHIWLGGVMGCEESYAEIIDLVGREIGTKLAMLSFIHRKNLYRGGVFKCVVRAGEGTDHEEARPLCGCLDHDLESGEDYLEVMDSLVLVEDLLESFDEDTTREVVSVICSAPMAEGDQLQASSPVDPTFWPTHPTMERLLMYKRLTGTMTDLTWPDEDTADTTTPTGTTQPKRLSLFSDQCVGHGGSDVFPFGLLDTSDNPVTVRTGISLKVGSAGGRDGVGVGGGGVGSGVDGDIDSGSNADDGSGGDGGGGGGDGGGGDDGGNNLSNREVLQALDPRLNSLPYVYDTFTWNHCAEQGIDFDNIWTTEDVDEDAEDIDYPAAYLPLTVRSGQTGARRELR